MEELIAQHKRRFVRTLGDGGEVTAVFSPGRVNLMGAHLDYNEGPVLPMAIDRGTFVALRPRADRKLRLASESEEGRLELHLDDLGGERGGPEARTGSWFDYPLGVFLHELARRPEAPGIDAFFGGNLRIGAGLSSSASICVGTAVALQTAWGLEGARLEAVEAALWAEREFVGVQCGIMDPYAVGLCRADHLLWLDCRDRSTEHLPLDSSRLRIAVADSGVRRDLVQGAFNARVEECARAFEHLSRGLDGARTLRDVPRAHFEDERPRMDPVLARRAQHVLEELERAHVAREALVRGDAARFGEQMSLAHESLRDLFEVSIPELDHLVETARAWEGVLGARLTGAGFGGCIVALLEAEACEGFAAYLSDRFQVRFGRPVPVEFFRGGPGARRVVA